MKNRWAIKSRNGHKNLWDQSEKGEGDYGVKDLWTKVTQHIYAHVTTLNTCIYTYDGRPINKLQNGIILFIFKILKKIRNPKYRFCT